jgi:hypothetical protein
MKAIVPRTYHRLSAGQKAELEKYVSEAIEQGTKEAVKKATGIALDCAVMLSALVLIDEFNFGTIEQKGKQSRLMRFMESYQRKADAYGQTYDEAVFEAMRLHLKNQGFEFGVK